MTWNRLAAVLVALAPLVHTEAQTLPLPAGAGFTWERVGDVPSSSYRDLTFDAGGTLWDSNSPPRWLDRSGGGAGRWVISDPPGVNPDGNAILTLGPHPAGGPARADTLVITYGYTERSVNGGATYEPWYEGFNWALAEIPRGVPHAGRVLAGNEGGFSDDRGATWTPAVQNPSLLYSLVDFLPLPAADRLPGAASGRATGAPPDWPAGRVVAASSRGVALSDDGGASYRPSSLFTPNRAFEKLALVRRPEAHPLGAGPRLLAAGNGGGSSFSVWSSDDAGATWQFRAFTPEPIDGPGGGPQGLFALSETGEADPGAGGAAILVLGRGHLYRTDDGGETWAVAGRTPQTGERDEQGNTLGALVGTAEVGPDGHLYVGISWPINRGWVWRTTEPLAVADEAGPVEAGPVEAGKLDLVVRPNPASGRVEVVLSLAEAGSVRVTVVDALGREVTVVLNGAAGLGETVVDVETGAWPAGVYVVRAEASGCVVSARLVVAR